jgi:hypothetical protein
VITLPLLALAPFMAHLQYDENANKQVGFKEQIEIFLHF